MKNIQQQTVGRIGKYQEWHFLKITKTKKLPQKHQETQFQKNNNA